MELALQDDAVFVDQRWMDARQGARPRRRPRDQAHPRQRPLGALLVSGAEHRTPPAAARSTTSRKIDALQAAAAAARHQAAADRSPAPRPPGRPRDHKVGGNRPDPVKFGAFARTVAAHFKGRVDRYSIWNEPNLSAWLSPSKSAPKLYRSLYTAGYTAIKTVDPKAKVLFGELAPNRDGRTIAPLKFLRDVTCSKANYKAARKCAPLKADGLAHAPLPVHESRRPIAAGGPDDTPISQLSRLTKALDKLAKRKRAEHAQGQARPRPLPDRVRLPQRRQPQAESAERPRRLAALRLQRSPARTRASSSCSSTSSSTRPRDELWHSAILDRHGRPLGAYAGLAKACRRDRALACSAAVSAAL